MCPKFKRGMFAAVTSMTTPIRVMLRIYSAVILVAGYKFIKNETNLFLFCFAAVKRLRAEMISK